MPVKPTCLGKPSLRLLFLFLLFVFFQLKLVNALVTRGWLRRRCVWLCYLSGLRLRCYLGFGSRLFGFRFFTRCLFLAADSHQQSQQRYG